MSSLSNKGRERLAKAFTVLTGITTTLSLSGVMYLAPTALAVAPADYGLKEGDVVSAAGSDDPDVYIVNELGYKRLFLNPVIFGFYGHLGGFGAVKNVSAATRDAFGTSGLFRNCETNDEKVYGVQTTGEDVGMLHWVNTSGSQAVADDPNFFKKVFCINSNEFNWYPKGSDYTSVNQVPSYARGGTPVPVAGTVNVGLAPDNTAAMTLTQKAVGVTYLKVRLSGSGTLSNLTVTRGGAGASSEFSNVYIYDGVNRLTTGKSLSSSTGKVTFVGLNVAVNGQKDLSIVADMNATVGQVNYLSIQSASDVVLSSGTVGGSFPVMGNNMTISGQVGGTYNVAKTGSLSNPNVGQKNVKLSQFEVTANTEGGWVKRLQMINNGTLKDSDLTNLNVQVAGATVGTGWMHNGYVVLDLSGGVFIEKGNNKTFSVYGDVTGKKSETVELYFESDADVLMIGDQFGFGVAENSNTLDTAVEADAITLQGGVITLTFNGPTAANVADKSQDVPVLEFALTAAKAVELKKHEIVLCWDDGADGTFNAVSANGLDDLEDIKIKNKATGVILVGPGDGTNFTTSDTSCPGGIAGRSKTFTDTFEVGTGTTLNLVVTADVKTSNDSDGDDLTDGDIVKVIIGGYGDLAGSAGDLTVARYSGTNTAVTSADFSPSGDTSSNNMTITTSSLTLGLAGSPVNATYVKGTSGVDLAGLTVKAALGSGLKVTDITLTGYVSDDNTTFDKSKSLAAPDASLSVQDKVAGVMLYDGDTGALISSVPSANNLNSTTSTVVFNNLSWQIPAGATKKLLVKGNLSTNATSGSLDGVAFDIAATGDMTAVDDFGTSVNPGAAKVNGTLAAPTVKMKVADAGSLTLSLSPATPSKEAKYWGQAGTEYSRFRLNSTDEGFYLERLIFMASGSENTDMKNNVKSVAVTYVNKAGSTLTATSTPNSEGSVSFGFAGNDRPYVPKDSSLDVIVKADMKTKAEGATTNKTFSVDFSDRFNGSNANGFRAVGEGSGTVLDGSSTNINDVLGNNHIVYRVFPKFDQVSVSTGEPLGTKDVLKFTITAMGLSDSKLFFDGDIDASGSVKFEIVASGQVGGTDSTFTLYDAADGSTYDSGALTGTMQNPSPKASLAFDFATKDLEISGGQSKTLRVEAAFAGFADKSDYFQLILRDDEAGLINWVDNSTGASTDLDTASTTTYLRFLPMNGPTFTKL